MMVSFMATKLFEEINKTLSFKFSKKNLFSDK